MFWVSTNRSRERVSVEWVGDGLLKINRGTVEKELRSTKRRINQSLLTLIDHTGEKNYTEVKTFFTTSSFFLENPEEGLFMSLLGTSRLLITP